MSVKENEPAEPAGTPGPAEPKKFRPGFLFQLEEQRRQRRLNALQQRFDATIQHIEQVERVNEEFYRRQMEVTQAAKTGSSIPPPPPPRPFPPPTPVTSTPPAGDVFRKPWIRTLLRPPAGPAPAAKPAPKPPKAGAKKKRKK